MIDMLSDLDDCAPSVRGELLFTVITLHIQLSELDNKCLLYFGVVIQLFLYCNFDLYSL
jgi:hypothetical protein